MTKETLSQFVEWVIQQVKDGDDDAIAGAILAAIAYAIDFHYFPDGMPAAHVSVIAGVLGFLLSRWIKNRAFVLEWKLKRIDRWVEQKHITPAEAQQIKFELIRRLIKNTTGTLAEQKQEAKQIEPGKEDGK